MEAKSSLKSSLKKKSLGKDNVRKIKHTCEYCDYTTSKMSNYKKHLKSKKHIKNVTNSGYQKSSLKEPVPDKEKIITKESSDKLLREVIKEQQQQIKTLIDVVKEIKSTGSTTNNTNCNNTIINNHITVDVYLNDHCKDALNIRDFVDQIEVQIEDILHPSKLLKDNIVPNLFMNNLNKLSNEERPVHCADARRGKFFVKDNDEWTEIKKEEPLNPLNSQIGMLKLEVYKKAQEAEKDGIINDKTTQKIRDACEISGPPTKINNNIVNKIASECSLLEARKKKSLENID